MPLTKLRITAGIGAPSPAKTKRPVVKAPTTLKASQVVRVPKVALRCLHTGMNPIMESISANSARPSHTSVLVQKSVLVNPRMVRFPPAHAGTSRGRTT
jgi:hypothetical protein